MGRLGRAGVLAVPARRHLLLRLVALWLLRSVLGLRPGVLPRQHLCPRTLFRTRIRLWTCLLRVWRLLRLCRLFWRLSKHLLRPLGRHAGSDPAGSPGVGRNQHAGDAELRQPRARRQRPADRADTGGGASDRRAERSARRTERGRIEGQRDCRSLVPQGCPAYPGRPAGRRRETARGHAQGGAGRAHAAAELLRLAERGAEAAVRRTRPIEQVVQPTAEQQDAFNGLKAGSAKAAEGLQASCPAQTPTTPLARLDAVGT